MTDSSFTLAPTTRDNSVEAQVHVRWDIKTGSDASAKNIDSSHPTQTTIPKLRSFAAPAAWPPPGRVKDVETVAWQLSNTDTTLVGYKHEQDGDYHLVLQDANGDTMIAEIPDPADAAGSTFLDLITAARQVFSQKFGVQLEALDAIAESAPVGSAPMIIQVSFPVTITGVGFFDFIHGQAGVAPNGIELHPVVGIDFS
jgi:hypothetical protein